MDLTEVLFSLSEACGVSGDERESGECAARWLRPLVDSVKFDTLGNVVGFRACGRAGAKTVLLDAHLDEVGLMVTGNDGCLLKFSLCVGGVDARMLPGLRVKVLTEEGIHGVITCPQEEQGKAAVPEQLRIDCGLTEEQAKAVPVGTRVAYGTRPWERGNRVFGKSMDDRACFGAILRAMELTRDEKLPVNVVVLGSVQEETGGVGAMAGTFGLRPDAALVVDVTFGDSPDSPKDHSKPLGSGNAIGFSPVLDRKMTLFLRKLASENGLAHTSEIMEGSTGTNSMHTQIAGDGVPSVLISLPQRYMHTPVECVDLGDVEALAQLIALFLRNYEEVAS